MPVDLGADMLVDIVLAHDARAASDASDARDVAPAVAASGVFHVVSQNHASLTLRALGTLLRDEVGYEDLELDADPSRVVAALRAAARRGGGGGAATKFKFKFSSVPVFRYAARAGGARATNYYHNYYYGAYWPKAPK